MTTRLTIRSNIASIQAQRRLGSSTEALRDSFTRLSSGLRINKASDDAAGLAIASSLETDRRVYAQGLRNLNDGLSILNIAEGALNELRSITQRHIELAEQSANGTYSQEQRSALQAESDALVAEFNRIARSTTFNDTQVLQEEISFRLQDGYGQSGGIDVSIEGLPVVGSGDGTFQSVISIAGGATAAASADFNGDGIGDIGLSGTSGVSFLLGSEDGSYTQTQSFDFGQHRDIDFADVNGDGIIDSISTLRYTGIYVNIGNGDGTFQAHTLYAAPLNGYAEGIVGDVNNDGNLDLTAIQSNGNVGVFLGNGDGSFGAVRESAGFAHSNGAMDDFNGDGYADLVVHSDSPSQLQVLLGDGSGYFTGGQTFATAGSGSKNVDVGDLDGDGNTDLITANGNRFYIHYGNGDGTFESVISYSGILSSGGGTVGVHDINNDGIDDFVVANQFASVSSVVLSDGMRSFTESQVDPVPGINSGSDLWIGDVNGDGLVDILAPSSGGANLAFGNGESDIGISNYDISSQQAARETLEEARDTLDSLIQVSASIGAYQSRISSAINVKQTLIENNRAAESQITDVDVAAESARLVRAQILQQAGAAILAQANIQPQFALTLLNNI